MSFQVMEKLMAPPLIFGDTTKFLKLTIEERFAKMKRLLELAEELFPCFYVLDLPELLSIQMDDPRVHDMCLSFFERRRFPDEDRLRSRGYEK
jgi:hypothetical protein